MADIITRQYTYKLPDTYYGDTNELGKTASAMYEGYASGWVAVEKDTGRLCVDESFYPDGSEDADQLAELEDNVVKALGGSRKAIKLDIAGSLDDALIAAIVSGQNISDWPTVDYAFPEGHPNAGEVYHTDVDPLPVNDVLDYDKIFYDFETNTWKIDEIPFAKPHCPREAHEGMVQYQKEYAIALKDKHEFTAEQLAVLDAHIAELDNLYIKFAGIHHLMIKFPDFPQSVLFPDEEPPATAEEVA